MQSKELYTKYSPSKHWELHPTIYAESFTEFLKNKKFHGKIVDIGCGTGRDVNVFVQHGLNALGIDNSEKEIALTKQKFPKLRFEVQDAEHLDFASNSIDACYTINVIHYVDKEKAINEILRILKPRGYFFIHFNIDIIDKNGKIDYHQDLNDILQSISMFKIIKKQIFERTDNQPIEHKHKIIELILQKP